MDENAERYRLAAEDALAQLDWCIGYLCGIKKARIARVLSRNRAYIKRNLMREPAAPLPSEEGLPSEEAGNGGAPARARRLSHAS